mmetsp:Transcript_11109/g.31428  ORF Transcript_11109/g.31428 Transcript_11109/m.31428 type:complete len:231 (-) Transcript_11109:397-1089(-)
MCALEFAGNSECKATHKTPNLFKNSRARTASSASFTKIKIFFLHKPNRNSAIKYNNLSFFPFLISKPKCVINGFFFFFNSFFISRSSRFLCSISSTSSQSTSAGFDNNNDFKFPTSSLVVVALTITVCTPSRHLSNTYLISFSCPNDSNKSHSSKTIISNPSPLILFGGKSLSLRHCATRAGVDTSTSGQFLAASRTAADELDPCGNSPTRYCFVTCASPLPSLQCFSTS